MGWSVKVIFEKFDAMRGSCVGRREEICWWLLVKLRTKMGIGEERNEMRVKKDKRTSGLALYEQFP